MDACSASILLLTLIHLLPSISARDFLSAGSSLSVEQSSDVLHSRDGTFACGFYNISPNASTFSIWFSRSSERTIVWSANPLHPVYSWGSEVKLDVDGSMVLKDYNGQIVWSNNVSASDAGHIQAQLLGNGNLIVKGKASILTISTYFLCLMMRRTSPLSIGQIQVGISGKSLECHSIAPHLGLLIPGDISLEVTTQPSQLLIGVLGS